MGRQSLIIFSFSIILGCKNILTELEQSQVTGLLSASFLVHSPINFANQSEYEIKGHCGKNGSTITILPGIGSTTCKNRRFRLTTDMSGHADGSFNLTLDAAYGGFTIANADSQLFIKDTLVPSGTFINFNRDNAPDSYQISGDCNEEGAVVRANYATIFQDAVCNSGSYSMMMDLSVQFPLTPVLPSDFSSLQHPFEVIDESSDDEEFLYRLDYIPTYTEFNLRVSFTDSAGNSSSHEWPVEINQKTALSPEYSLKTGHESSVDCSDLNEYQTSPSTLGVTISLDKINFFDGDVFKLCAKVVDEAGHQLVLERKWDVRSYPRVNNFACNLTGNAPSGTIGCYGMWDSGNAFGNDVNMCGGASGGIGCSISASACASGSARATRYFNPRLLEFSDPTLELIAMRLATYKDLVLYSAFGMWEYTCN